MPSHMNHFTNDTDYIIVFDCTGNIVVVHNGIIENYQSLKEELLKKGHTFKSETDTEVIVHLLEEELKTVDSNYEERFLQALCLLKCSLMLHFLILPLCLRI